MATATEFVSRIRVDLDGKKVDRKVMQGLLEVVVEQHIHLPDVFRLRFADPDLELIDKGDFDLTKKIKVMADKEDETEVTLVEGEITALEPNFEEGMLAELVIHGYDSSHRMFRETKSKAYLNQKDSDLAEEIAKAAKLEAKVDGTKTVYEHIFQHNQTDLGFLMERAWRIGYECFVREGKLYFRKPPKDADALELTWGKDLLSFQPRLNLAEQVDEVTVRGWDAEQLKPIVGRAQKGNLYPKIGESKDGASLAKPFGRGKLVIVDQPVINQAEADTLATARLDEISGTFLEAEGRCFKRPDIQAGCFVKLKSLGERFSGTYLVTSASHVYSAEGLVTSFEVRGARTGLLRDALAPVKDPERWQGVVVGIVTNTDDPKGWGRVKVKFPWLTDDAESDWARLATIGGGPEAGLSLIPAVDDEVLVSFMNGNFSQPVVLGGLWNGKHKVPTQTSGAKKGEKPKIRVWHSRSGHSITMYDSDENKIEIKTASGYIIALDDKKKNVSITGPGELKISMDKDITVEGKADLKIKTTGDITMESNKNINIKAGLQLKLEGNAQATLKAATTTVEGSAVAEVKGGMVKLN